LRYLLLALLGLLGTANAQAPARDGYLGVGLGGLSYEIRSDGEKFFDTTAKLWKFYGGFRLTRHWQFEGSYQVTETNSRNGLPTSLEDLPISQLPGTATTTVRLEVATLRALRLLPYSWGSMFIGFGVSGAAVDTKLELTSRQSVGAGFHVSKNGLNLGGGAQWDFPTLSLRLEYEWWDADMSAVELSMHWRL
jgi:opacity protein-like surface antigen